MRTLTSICLLTLFLGFAASPSEGRPARPVEVHSVDVKGQVEEANFTMLVTIELATRGRNVSLDVVAGDVVVEELIGAGRDDRLRYDRQRDTYTLTFARRGEHRVQLRLAARSQPAPAGWRRASLALPAARARPIAIDCDRVDLQIELPGAVRIERLVSDGKLTVTGLQGSAEKLAVLWKPQVQQLEAKLVASSQANTIIDVTAGTLRLDSLYVYEISQGRLEQLRLGVPAQLRITQVRGLHIRDWQVAGDEGTDRELLVTLNRPQTSRYGLQVVAEMALPAFPAQVTLPVIEPTTGIRAGGHVAIGTDSAIQLIPRTAAGLSQIDSAAMPRVALDPKHPRPLPRGKVFFYSHPAGAYQALVDLDHVVPAFDAAQRVAVRVGEDDLALEVQIELDVRDSALRELELRTPAGFSVVAVSGAQVDDHRVTAPGDPGEPEAPHSVRVLFKEPLLGRAALSVRLELGRTPLTEALRVRAIEVVGAASQRGYLVVAVEDGLELTEPATEGLREVHTASAPMKVAGAQYAYRFRDTGYALNIQVAKKPAGIRVETFHLVSLGEGVAHGSVVVSYFVTGSPVDTLEFTVAPELENVQFVGRDVRRFSRDGDDPSKWTVSLHRKVIGDYNLGITYNQRYDDGGEITVGGVICNDAETRVGYLALASHLNLKLTPGGDSSSGLLPTQRDEIPANYRLLVDAPLLASYKYVSATRPMPMGVEAYERGTLAPVVVELVEAITQIAPHKGSAVESVTRVRYKIKNVSSQFLTLKMPAGASVWSTRLLERDGAGGEQGRRIAASHDKAAGLLMVPIQRPRDPNAPITVELEYGQVHGSLPVGGRLALAAPVTDVRSTFDNWSITVPAHWAVLPTGGSMQPMPRPVTHGSLGRVLRSVGASWAAGAQRLSAFPTPLAAGLIAVCALGLVLLFARRAALGAGAAIALTAAVWIGAVASQTGTFDERIAGDDNLQTVSYAQVIHLDRATPLEVGLRVVPAWRQHASVIAAAAAAGAGLLALAAAVLLRRWRAALAALGVTGLLFGACQFPVAGLVVGHVLTWGLPLLLLGALVWRAIGHVHPWWRPAVGAASIALAVALAWAPGAGAEDAVQAAAVENVESVAVTADAAAEPAVTEDAAPAVEILPPVVIDRIDCKLRSESDSVEAVMRITIATRRPVRVPLLEPGTVLLSFDGLTRSAELVEEDGRYFLNIRRAGRYAFVATFLRPLRGVDGNQVRRFELPLPLAMSTRVTMVIPEEGIDVRVPAAVRVEKEPTAGGVSVVATLAPGEPFRVEWRPRDRRHELESTRLFASVTSAVRFDAGLIEALHDLDLQIAQGQLDRVHVDLPLGMTVTAVRGEHLGTWRYDPVTRRLEVRLSRPVTGRYRLHVVTRIAADRLPAEVSIGAPIVGNAAHQRSIVGLLTSAAAEVTVTNRPQMINVDDFARDAGPLLGGFSGGVAGGVRFACRLDEPGDVVSARVVAVHPELRSHEIASFTVADERLVYNGKYTVTIAKAGVFSARIVIPDGYDIDTLSAPRVSHWDESQEAGGRVATVHFKGRTLGAVTLELTMSRSISRLPDELDVPRVVAVGSLKHTGQVVVSAERGVRLSVRRREGVSELNPAAVGDGAPGTLLFKLVRPAWTLRLATETVQPRVTVDFLHVARVGDGIVRHANHLSYRLHHAGAKDFLITVPSEALGLLITGPDIARRTELGDGAYRIELTGKWFDRPYPLTVQYETPFDRSGGAVSLEPVRAEGAALQRGFVAVTSGDRVQLAATKVGRSLQVAESRTVPRTFGAGDLSDAVLCYRASSGDYAIDLRATRHAAATLLEADVLSTTITTVATRRGDSINRVEMQLRVGSKRHLRMKMPAGAEVWSLLVNGRSTAPSITTDAAGDPLTLIPLAQAASGRLPVQVDLVYVLPAAGPTGWSRPSFDGPRFDLPLRDVRWVLYLPDDHDYDGFEGTLEVDRTLLRSRRVATWGLDAYEQQVQQIQLASVANAIRLQDEGNKLAEKGEQRAAKAALESAWYYSLSDAALNEDARVQLHRLNRDQSLVGLVGNRARLRQRDLNAAAAPDAPGENFSRGDAERIRNSLSKADSENLDVIISRLIETQEAAAGAAVPLNVQMPLRGRVLAFTRPIQVKPMAPMTVSFGAERVAVAGTDRAGAWAAGLFVVLAVLFSALPKMLRRLGNGRIAESGAEG